MREIKRALFNAWAGKRDSNRNMMIRRYLFNMKKHNFNNNKDSDGETKIAYKKAFAPWAGKRSDDDFSAEKRRPWGGDE